MNSNRPESREGGLGRVLGSSWVGHVGEIWKSSRPDWLVSGVREGEHWLRLGRSEAGALASTCRDRSRGLGSFFREGCEGIGFVFPGTSRVEDFYQIDAPQMICGKLGLNFSIARCDRGRAVGQPSAGSGGRRGGPWRNHRERHPSTARAPMGLVAFSASRETARFGGRRRPSRCRGAAFPPPGKIATISDSLPRNRPVGPISRVGSVGRGSRGYR